MEEWKDICDFVGAYQVSNIGRVRSLDRLLTNSKGVSSNVKGRVLKPQVSGSGYYFVQLGVGKAKQIHRLVALAFLPTTSNKSQVNHIDGNKLNNHVDNLEWVSCSDNHKHSYENLDRKLHSKSKIICLKKDGFEVRFHGCNAAAKYLGVVAGSVASAVKNNHKCKGWSVKYETCEIKRFREFKVDELPR
jgi:hypothetical protein